MIYLLPARHAARPGAGLIFISIDQRNYRPKKTRWPIPCIRSGKCRETDIVRLAKYRLTKLSFGDLSFWVSPLSLLQPSVQTNQLHFVELRSSAFFAVGIDPIRQFTPSAYQPCNPGSRLAANVAPTYMVCRGRRPSERHFYGSTKP